MDRFWAKVEKSDACWTWTAAIQRGYGRFWNGESVVAAHRVAYELLVGPIPDGLVLDHLCRNKACVNPAHLEPVTQRVNIQRGDHTNTGVVNNARLRNTHCPQGHPYEGSNLYITPSGSRQCRACGREQTRRYKIKKRSPRPTPVRS